jgi:hypothetical protein
MDAQFGIIPKIVCPATCWTWILPSSRRLGFLHLIIHVRYVRGQTMLIRCCFATTIMVNTISFASSWSSFKFSPAIGIVHHVLLQHLDSYSDHATLFLAQVWGGGYMRISSQPPFVHCIYMCMHIFLVDYFILVFLLSRIYYRFTPLRHHTSRHYMSRHLSCSYMASYMMASYGHAHVRF